MDVSALLDSFASAFGQDTRLFQLHFADGGLDGQLLPYTLCGEEAVSESYRLELTCLCPDTTIELKRLMGQPVDIAIGLADGGERLLSGVVTQAKLLGADGGFATYGLVVEPAFAVLKLRRNSRVFQDKSIVDIVRLILDEHSRNNPAFARSFRYREQLTAPYPTRSYCQQYRESDLAFIERLLCEEGISYYFDFAHGADEIGVHTLVLFDAGTELDAAPHSAIRFHRADATEDADSMTTWHATRQLQSASLDLASFDYKGVYTQQGSDHTAIDHGDAGSALVKSLIDYEPQSLYYGADNSAMNRYATLRQQAKDLRTKSFTGSGAVRGVGAGQWFTLNDHPIHDDGSEADRQFIVLRHQFHARNNLPGDLSDVIQSLPNTGNVLPLARRPSKPTDPSETPNGAGYWNQVEAIRKHIPIVPTYSETEHAKPTAPGSQTAMVVGPAGEEIYTDESGRIKIQFHWAREQDHDVGQHGAGAAKDDHSSCWVRVMMPCTGNQWGHEFLPRIGQEAKIIFIEGDIDRPLCIGVVHNGQHNPPTFSGAGSLPANKTLSGIKSQEYKGSRYNELVFDDTTGEIRTKFSSEHGKTQLNQGYLIHPRSEGQGTPRGEGFELRTDNAGSIRAAQGLLLTTEAQQNGSGNQLDRTAAQSQLEAAQNLTIQLGDTAHNQRANQPAPDKLDADHFKSKEPYLQLHGQGGVALTTPQAMAIVTGKDFNQIAQRDTHQTSGRRWIHNVGESISLFVTGASNKLKESIKLIAAKGNIQIQAQSGDVEITADKKFTITACKEKLIASAKKEFLLTAGGGYIKFSGGNIEIAAPKNLSMKAGSFEHVGPVSQTVAAPVLPQGDYNPIKQGIAGFDDTTFLGGMANGVLNQAAVITSAFRKDGLTVQPFTGVEVSKPDQQDAKFYNLVGIGGFINRIGVAGKAALGSFTGKYKGNPVTLENIEMRNINYVRRNPEAVTELRKEFNSKARKGFLKKVGTDADSVADMKRAGLSESQIAEVKFGEVPDGFSVHHKLPLDDGGTNEFDNLVLIRNTPEHSVITTFQRAATGNIPYGGGVNLDFPVPPGTIYPIIR